MPAILFADSRVQDLHTLLFGLDPDIEVILLDPTRDGIDQMAEALAGRWGLDAIHVISHGAPGMLQLGSTWLGGDNLASYQSQFASISQALTYTGDLLLYGCNVAAGERGEQFIASLAHWTGADVAASTNRTGAGVLGGDWVLESTFGSVEVTIPITHEAQSTYTQALGFFQLNGINGGAFETRGLYPELALLAVKAYEAPNISMPLEIDSKYYDASLESSFYALDQRWTPLPDGTAPNLVDGVFINENAAAYVATAVVDGIKTLAISFRGTDFDGNTTLEQAKDALDWFHVASHYDKFGDLIASLDGPSGYIAANGIQQVFVTGHSLGGAAAQIFMANHPDGTNGANYLGATFASPGADTTIDDRARLAQFANTRDLVPAVGLNTPNQVVLSVEAAIAAGSGIVWSLVKDLLTNALVDAVGTGPTPKSGWYNYVGSAVWLDTPLNTYLNTSQEHDSTLYAEEIWRLAGLQDQPIFSADGSTFTALDLSHVIIGYGTQENASNLMTGDPWGIDHPLFLVGGRYSDAIDGGSRNDWIWGLEGDDILYGGAGNDYLNGGKGNDFLAGEGGDDFLVLSPGVDNIDGGAGNDILIVNLNNISHVSFVLHNDPFLFCFPSTGGWVTNIEHLNVTTGNGDDYISNRYINGNDIIDTGDGNDWVDSGSGTDSVYTQGGDDYVVIDMGQQDIVDTGPGDDWLVVNLSNGNQVTYLETPSGVVGPYSSWESIKESVMSSLDNKWLGFPFLVPNDGRSELIHTDAGTASNVEHINILGGDADDLIVFYGGDHYSGGSEPQYINALGDTFYADWSGATNSIVWDNDPASVQTVNGVMVSELERLLLQTGAGDDLLKNTGVETDDTFLTGDGNDTVHSGGGDDRIESGAGNDVIEGGPGNDVIDAGEGDDVISDNGGTIDGGPGFDVLTIDASGSWMGSELAYNVGTSTSSFDAIRTALGAAETIALNTGMGFVTYRNIEELHITGIDNAGSYSGDLLIFQGRDGSYQGGGQGVYGHDAFYADWSTATDSIVWDNAPSSVQTVNGVIVSGLERLLLQTGAGDDLLKNTGTYSDDTFITGAGNDTVHGGYGNDYIDTGDGNDLIDAGIGDDTVYAGSGDDRIYTGIGYDSVDGGAGDDYIDLGIYDFGSYDCIVDGGAGQDSIKIEELNTIEGLQYLFDLSQYIPGSIDGSITVTYRDSYQHIKNVLASASSTALYGSTGGAIRYGNIENFILYGDDVNGGDLLICGAGGAYHGRGQNDDPYFNYYDSFYADWSGHTTNIIWHNDPAADSIQLSNEIVVSGIERLLIATGTGNDDVSNIHSITDDYIDAGPGNDTVDGGPGSDELLGGDGDDVLYGNVIAHDWFVDRLEGGYGDDSYYVGFRDIVAEDANGGTDTVYSYFTWSLGVNFENLVLAGTAETDGSGNALDNVLVGNAGRNVLTGYAGNDTLAGGGGNDTLSGGIGNDCAVYSGKAADYRVDLIQGVLIVTDLNVNNGDEGIDSLRAIDTLTFSDKSYTLKQGSEFQVGTNATNTTMRLGASPTSTTLSDGGYVIAWASSEPSGELMDIYAQRYAADGSLLVAEFQVNTFMLNDQLYPTAIALDDGGWLITWQSLGQDGYGSGIYAQRYAADGSLLGVESQINTYTAGTQQIPAVTVLTDGGWLVAWQSFGQDGSHEGIYAQRYGLYVKSSG